MYYTYILYSLSIDTFYKGSTTDIADRLKRHNGGREKYTKKGAPWNLLWYVEKPSKSEAYKLELKLKNLSRKRTLELMLKYSEGIAGSDATDVIVSMSEC